MEDPRKEEEQAREREQKPERGVASLAKGNPGAKQPALGNSAVESSLRSGRRCTNSFFPRDLNTRSCKSFPVLLPNAMKAKKKGKALQNSPT